MSQKAYLIAREILKKRFIASAHSANLEGKTHQRFCACINPDSFLDLMFSQVLRDSLTLARHDQRTHIPRDKFDFLQSQEVLERIKDRIRKNEPIDAPTIFLQDCAKGTKPLRFNENCFVEGHEGRHRSLAALQEGVKEIPVIFDAAPLKNWPEFERIRNRPDLIKQILDKLRIQGRIPEKCECGSV